MPEADVPFVVEPLLYLREHEVIVIPSELSVLRYRVHIRVIEVQDWTTPTSSSDDAPGDSDFEFKIDKATHLQDRTRCLFAMSTDGPL
jgi:hypothetical protein